MKLCPKGTIPKLLIRKIYNIKVNIFTMQENFREFGIKMRERLKITFWEVIQMKRTNIQSFVIFKNFEVSRIISKLSSKFIAALRRIKITRSERYAKVTLNNLIFWKWSVLWKDSSNQLVPSLYEYSDFIFSV